MIRLQLIVADDKDSNLLSPIIRQRLLDEPIEENSTQATVFGYLELYVGNMKNEEARCFLRYTTGSLVLIGQHITVGFNSLSGFAWRPTAHTCGCELELPSTYLSYLEFEKEFNAISFS